MKPLATWTGALVLAVFLISPQCGWAQTRSDAAPATPSSPTPDYPPDRGGVLIASPDWTPIDSVMPTKMRAKGAIAQSLSYGAIRGTAVADYNGEHAAIQVKPGRVSVCLCRVLSLPGDPIIVKLHPQKGMRELDGGKLAILGGKIADASKSDLVPVEVTRPDTGIWLVRSQEALPEGEYALMLGTQNMAVFPFTISTASNDASSPSSANH